MAHQCPRCFKSFVRPAELARHLHRKTPCVHGGSTTLLSAEHGVLAQLEHRIQHLEAELQILRAKQTNALVNIFIGQTHVTFTPTQEKEKPNAARVRQIVQQVESHPDTTIHVDNPDILMCVVRALGEQQETINVSDFILSPSGGDSLPPRTLPGLSPT